MSLKYRSKHSPNLNLHSKVSSKTASSNLKSLVHQSSTSLPLSNPVEPKVRKIKQVAPEPTAPVRSEPKSNLSKFLNKGKPNYLKDTSGSKKKREFGIERANRNRTASRERKILSAKEKLNNKKAALEDKDTDIHGIAKYADEFWDNLEEEKKKTRGLNKERAHTPLNERITFSTKMKLKAAKNTRKSNHNQDEKPKNTNAKVPLQRKYNSNSVSAAKREIIASNRIGKKNVQGKDESKDKIEDKEKLVESQYYSPIQNRESSKEDKDVTPKYEDQNFWYDPVQSINNNDFHTQETQNIDSTLHLTMDDKEILNVNWEDIQHNN